MENAQRIVNLVPKAVAVGAAASSIVLGTLEALVTMPGIGLATLSIAVRSEVEGAG